MGRCSPHATFFFCVDVRGAAGFRGVVVATHAETVKNAQVFANEPFRFGQHFQSMVHLISHDSRGNMFSFFLFLPGLMCQFSSRPPSLATASHSGRRVLVAKLPCFISLSQRLTPSKGICQLGERSRDPGTGHRLILGYLPIPSRYPSGVCKERALVTN